MGKVGTLGVDPEKDLAGRIGNECFLCGGLIFHSKDLGWFGQKPNTPDEQLVTLELPMHLSCMHGLPLVTVKREFNRRVRDLANLKRND